MKVGSLRCVGVAFLILAGCRGGFEADDVLPIAKVSPASLSNSDAWTLFDRCVGVGFIPDGKPIVARFDQSAPIAALKVYGPAPYRLSLMAADGGPLGPPIDLSKLAKGWHTVSSDTVVSTNEVTFQFTATGGVPAPVPEVELWALSDASPAKPDVSAAELPVGLVAFSADSKSDVIAPGNCASFEVSVDRAPAVFRNVHVVFDATGLFRTFSLTRTINGLASHGGSWLTGDSTDRTFSDLIDPSLLVRGPNEVQLCAPAAATNNVSIKNLRLVGELDRGTGLALTASVGADATDGRLLVDHDSATSVPVVAGERVVLEFERSIAPDAIVLSNGDLASAECITASGSRHQLLVKARTTTSTTLVAVDGGALACSALAMTFASTATIAEIDVIGSGAGERVDWPRLVVTSAPEHFGNVAWISGFVARPPTMPGAIRVDLTGHVVDGLTGEFSQLLTRSSDFDAAWPVAVKAQFPNGTAQSRQVVLGVDQQAQLRAASSAPLPAQTVSPASRFGTEGGSIVVRAATAAPTKIRLGTSVGADVPAGALTQATGITVRHLGETVLPPLDPGMINVTAPKMRGYEFLPHKQRFKKAIEVVLPYEPSLIPDGMTPNDVHTYFFDDVEKRWKPLERRAIDVGDNVARSATDHFTIMINAVLAVPKNPAPLSFDPTMMTSIAAASPAANVTLIEPPQANPSGDARVSYPLWAPKGRGAFSSPAPALTYSSAAGSSWLGVGWDLQLSRVEIDTRFGVPDYTGEPRYLLDGAQLVPTIDTDGPTCSGGGGTRYHARVESGFAHILRCGTSAETFTWEVHDRSGTLFVYGTGAAATRSPGLPANIFRWHLARVVDVNKNETSFEYEHDSDPLAVAPWTEVYPKAIEYTKHSSVSETQYRIEFQLDNLTHKRPDAIWSGRAGFKMVTRHLLRAVTVKFGNEQIRTYVLTYKPGQFGKTVLSTISVFGVGGCAPSGDAYTAPTKPCDGAPFFVEHDLAYHEDTEGFGAVETWSINGDPDSENGTLSKGRTISGSRRFGLGTDSGFASAGVTGGLGDRNELIGTYDINGDGLPDMVFEDDSDVVVLFNQSGTAATGDPLFSPAGPVIKGLTKLGDEDHFNVGADLSVGPVAGAFSSSVSRASRLFTDLDGDGFTDQLDATGDTLFGSPCAEGHCFSKSPTKTFDAIRSIDPRDDQNLQGISADNASRIAIGAPVIRWVAPYSGTVEVTATAERVRIGGSSGVTVDLWHQDTKVADTGLPPNSTGIVTLTTAQAIDVTAGEAFYMRIAGGQEDVAPDGTLFEEVDARLHVEYSKACVAGLCSSTQGLRTTAREPTGEFVFVFDSRNDFRVAGRPMPVSIPVDGTIDVHGLLDKHLTAADVRVCVQVYEHDTRLANMAVACNINVPNRVSYYAPTFLASDFDGVVAFDATAIPVKLGQQLVVRVESDPVGLTIDPEDVRLVPSLVGMPLVAFSSVCLPQPGGSPCIPDSTSATIARVPFDPSNFGAFVAVPRSPELALGEEREPPIPFVAPRSGTIDVEGFSSFHGDLVVRSPQRGVLARCTLGCPSPFRVDVLDGESVTFDLVRTSGSANDRALIRYVDDPALRFAVTIVNRDLLDTGIATPFVGDYRGWQYSVWNEAVAFEPTRLLEDYRVLDNPGDARLAEMMRSASLLLPNFVGSKPFWQAGSLVFIKADRQHGGALEVISTPSTGQGGLFASGYARMSCTTSKGVTLTPLEVSGGLDVSLGVGLTTSTTNTTTDVVDVNGDGIADVLASQKTLLGKLTEGAGGAIDDPDLGEGFRRRVSSDYSVELGGTATTPIISAAGRRLAMAALSPDSATASGGYKVGLAVSRTETTQELADVTGDGIPDLVRREGPKLRVRVGLGSRFGRWEDLGLKETVIPLVDGFAAKEQALSGTQPSIVNALGHDTTLTSFQSITAGIPFFSLSITTRHTSSRVTRQLVDLDGDGMADLVSKSGNQPVFVQWNLGGTFTNPRPWTTPSWEVDIAPEWTAGLGNVGAVPTIAGTWLNTLEVTSPDVLAGTGSQEGVTVSGGASIPIGAGVRAVFGASGSYDVDTYELSLFDIDGDGDADHVLRRKETDGPAKVFIKRNQLTGKANLLKTISRPLGGKIDLQYSRVGNTVAMAQSRQVLTTVTLDDGVDLGPKYASPQLISTIAYGAGFYHRLEKEFFGFDKVTTTRGDGGSVEETFNNTSYALHGRVLSSIHKTGGVAVSEQHVTYEEKSVVDGNGNVLTATAGCTAGLHPLLDQDACEPRLFLVTEQRDIRRELSGSASKVHVVRDTLHDRFGNVRASIDEGDEAIATDDVSVAVEYENRTSDWLIGLPTSIAVTQASSGQLLRQRFAVYTERGQVRELKVLLDEQGNLAETSFGYDSAGNLSSLTTPPNHKGFSQTYGVTYDPDTATYPARTEDGFGYRSQTLYDPRFGVATTEIAITGVTLTRTLDKFGRLQTVRGPYDLSAPGIVMQYGDPQASLPSVITTTHTSAPPGYAGPVAPNMTTVTFVDGLGRPVELRKSAVVNGELGMTTSGLVERDNVGRVVSTYHPFFTPDDSTGYLGFLVPAGPPPATTAVFDKLDRPLSVKYPDDSVDQTSYTLEPSPIPGAPLLFAAKSIAANGNRSEEYADLLGRMRAFVEHPTEPNATTEATATSRYDYLATGELSQVVDAEGYATQLGYDLRGLRTKMANPDTGLIEERFDPMGNRVALIEPNHRDPNQPANGVGVSFEYELNRLERVEYPTKPAVSMVYGASGLSAGRITTIEDETGTQEHTYGEQGEVVRTVRTVKGGQPSQNLTFDTRFAVDSLGRQLEIRYPDGLAIRSSYDGGGMLEKVEGFGAAGRVYASEIRYDVFGNRTRLRAGNGVVTSWEFDPKTVRLKNVDTILPGTNGRAIQALRYEYDPSGNPKAITNALPMLTGGTVDLPGDSTVTFAYDGADRLHHAAGSAQLNAQKRTTYVQDHRYTASHNLLSKSRAHYESLQGGTPKRQDATSFESLYGYTPARPHLPSTIGDLVITYDPSGNPIERKSPKRSEKLIWDDDGRMVEFVTKGVHQRNTYDASGLRVRRTVLRNTTQSGTVYASAFFEVENPTQGVRHVFAGDMRVASEVCNFASGRDPAAPAKSGTSYFYHGDQVGSTTVLTTDTGAVHESIEYFPDGETWIDRHPSRPVGGYLFSGKPLDPDTGFYDFGQRFYDPRTGIWLGVDPAAVEDGSTKLIGSPMMMAVGAYARWSPVRFRDPDGREVGDAIGFDFKRGTFTVRHSKIGTRVLGGMKVLAGGAGFVVGAALCETGVGCAIGGPLALASADVGGSGFTEALTGDAAPTTVGALFGPKAQQVQELIVNGAGLAGSVLNATKGVPVGGGGGGGVGGGGGGGVTIGLGLDADLSNHIGTGAITYLNGAWQRAGLTNVRWIKAVLDSSWFRLSFDQAAKAAKAIRFDLSSYNPAYSPPGMTAWELGQILNPANNLLSKTTFWKGAVQYVWNGKEFVPK